jgi:hypothetical protein
MARSGSYYLRRFETLQADKAQVSQKWQMVSDYILTRRDFSVAQRPNQLRPSRVTWGGAASLNTRMAAFVLAYLIDYSRPFLLPSVQSGLGVAGGGSTLDDPSITYLDAQAWNIYRALMRPNAQLMLSLGSILEEFSGFGCGLLWTGRRRGFGPYFQGRRVEAAYWAVNEEGEIDTLYYRLAMPKYRVLEKWPAAAAVFAGGDDKSEFDTTQILLCCEPRPDGKVGAVAQAKPWEFTVVTMDKGQVIDETGYDSFPYTVFRDKVLPGNAYAEGSGCRALPDVMIINHLQQCVENAASQKALPPLAMPARMFGRPLDRRMGAMNHYNPTALGMQRAQEAIVKLDLSGDPSFAIALMKDLKDDVAQTYYVDWQSLREAGDMTAEEVNERRDIRLRGMASIVANLEHPMSLLGARCQEILTLEGRIPPPPQPLSGANVDWEYAGPLQVAQLSGNVRAIIQWINAVALVQKIDAPSSRAGDLEESLRVLHNALALAPNTLNSHAKVEAGRAADAHAAQQQADAAKLAQVASAAKDGAGAVAAMGGGQGGDAGPAPGPMPGGGMPSGGGGAPFAPVNPFAQPVAA